MIEKNIERPTVVEYSENEWEFIFPESIDNENVFNSYWYGVDLLDRYDQEAEGVFKRIIEEHPFHIDAYNHLSIAFRNQKKIFESLLTAEKAYLLGKSCLPEKFNPKKDKLTWRSLDNRPFLRACQIYGLECQYYKRHDEAIKVFNENLLLNEDDHQGIRYLLLESYWALEDNTKVGQLIKKFKEDFSIEFKFGKVALNVLQNNYLQADKDIEIAHETNKYFIDEVVKTRHIKPAPMRLPGEPNFNMGITLGSIQQAYDYWSRNKGLYKKKKIIDYFKSKQAQTINNSL